jgi:hypothetical protein
MASDPTARLCPHCDGRGRQRVPPSPYGKLVPCAACGLTVLAAESRPRDGGLLLFDPGPDGEGEHFDTVLSDDQALVLGSGDATAIDCKGRFPLYRSHAWTCPERLMPPAQRAERDAFRRSLTEDGAEPPPGLAHLLKR